MPSHPLTNFEIQQHYQNKSKFNGIYSRHNLPKLKDGTSDKSWCVWTNRNSLNSFIC